MMIAQQSKCVFECVGVLRTLNVRKGESKTTGKPYVMHEADMCFLGGHLKLIMEQDIYETLEANKEYIVTGDLAQDGYDLRVNNVKFTSIVEPTTKK